MITIYSGLTGSGKSLALAKRSLELLERNRRFYEKTGNVRKVWSRMRFSDEIYEKYKRFIYYWDDMRELMRARGVDVIWDEMQVDVDATQWERIPMEFKRWLQLHRKFDNIEIYGTAQDFPTIYIGVRRLTHKLYLMKKLIGSPDPSATRPDVSYIWGLILMRSVKRDGFGKEKEEYQFEGIDFFFIRRKLCEAYDTQQEIFPAEYPHLRHIERSCQKCGKVKISHA